MTGDERVIAASLDRVATAVTDLERYPAWAHEVADVDVLARDADAMPARARLRFAAGALRDDVVLDYVVRRDEQALMMRWFLVSSNHLADLEGRYDLISVDAGTTLVVYSIRIDPGLPLHTALRTKMQHRVIEAALDALERYVTTPS